VWARPERAPFPGIVLEVLARHVPQERAGVLSSFALGDPDRLRGVLAAAGFADVDVRPTERALVFDGFDDLWDPIATGGARVSQLLLGLPPAQREAIREETRALTARYVRDGRITIDVATLVGVGVKA
jgi:hypothetical protein